MKFFCVFFINNIILKVTSYHDPPYNYSTLIKLDSAINPLTIRPGPEYNLSNSVLVILIFINKNQFLNFKTSLVFVKKTSLVYSDKITEEQIFIRDYEFET